MASLDLELTALIAEQIMGMKRVPVNPEFAWTKPVMWENPDGTKQEFDPLTDAAASKQLRDRLAEIWDTNLGRTSKGSIFAVWPKSTMDFFKPPAYCVGDADEFRAICLVAKKIAREKRLGSE